MFSKITTAVFFVANVFLFVMLVGLTWRYGTSAQEAGYGGFGRWLWTILGDKTAEAPAFSALDLVTTILAALGVLLTALGIFIAMLAIWGYQNLREHAKEAAEKTGREVAKEVAASAALKTAGEVAARTASDVARDTVIDLLRSDKNGEDFGRAAGEGGNGV